MEAAVPEPQPSASPVRARGAAREDSIAALAIVHVRDILVGQQARRGTGDLVVADVQAGNCDSGGPTSPQRIVCTHLPTGVLCLYRLPPAPAPGFPPNCNIFDLSRCVV